MDGKRKKVGYWMTEKKLQRLHFENFVTLCSNAGIDLVKIDFDRPLDHQGPFSVILHKLTDQMTRVQEKGTRSQIDVFQCYIDLHPEIIIIDPIENVLRLLDRRCQYQDVKDCNVVESSYHYFIPSFVELTSPDVSENKRLLMENDVRFPFVCKPSVSHLTGSLPSSAEKEEMAIIFNEKGLVDICPPCVAQSFVNHNARLFKIFVVGRRHFIIQRPSIRNFYNCNQETIFFNSSDISKSNSSCYLNQMDESDLLSHPLIEPDCKKMEHFVHGIQKKFGLDLLGIDVIIENDTGRYAVIDINAFPGYDGVPEFFSALLQLVLEKTMLANKPVAYNFPVSSSLLPQFSSGNVYGDETNAENRNDQDAVLKNTSGADEILAPKHNCSFLNPGTHYFYRSMSTQLSHPALCVCYREFPVSKFIKKPDRRAILDRFSVH